MTPITFTSANVCWCYMEMFFFGNESEILPGPFLFCRNRGAIDYWSSEVALNRPA